MNCAANMVLDVFQKDFNAENEIKTGAILKNRYKKVTRKLIFSI